MKVFTKVLGGELTTDGKGERGRQGAGKTRVLIRKNYDGSPLLFCPASRSEHRRRSNMRQKKRENDQGNSSTSRPTQADPSPLTPYPFATGNGIETTRSSADPFKATVVLELTCKVPAELGRRIEGGEEVQWIAN